MDDKSKKLIIRYIEGERKLYSKLKLMSRKLDQAEIDGYYVRFLIALFDDDNAIEMMKQKQLIMSEYKRPKMKRSK
jgi:hypothetical protein